jgi:outer membrane lipoprotein-sorting protein
MRSLIRCNLCLLLLLLALGSTTHAAAADVEEIVKKANLAAYYQGDNGKAKVTMTITDKKGQQRNREFIILRKDLEDGGDQNYFVYFRRPTDVRKMTYMVHKHAAVKKDDNRWLYLPALSLVKRIAAGDKRTSFVGSDFLYEDVSGRSLLEDTHELVETGDKVYLVKNTPKDPGSVEFSHFTVAIDKANFIPMKMEFFDKTGTLYRVIESTEVKEIQGFATVVKSLVKDLKTGNQTEMAFTDVAYDIKLKDIFTERYLRKPPREVTR